MVSCFSFPSFGSSSATAHGMCSDSLRQESQASWCSWGQPEAQVWDLVGSRGACSACVPPSLSPTDRSLQEEFLKPPPHRVSWYPWAQLPAVMATGLLEPCSPGTRESKPGGGSSRLQVSAYSRPLAEVPPLLPFEGCPTPPNIKHRLSAR